MTTHNPWWDNGGKPLFPSMEKSIDEVVDKKSAPLQERIKILETALRFYADEDNYVNVPIGYELMTRVEMDGGENARKALVEDVSDEAKKLIK